LHTIAPTGRRERVVRCKRCLAAPDEDLNPIERKTL